MNSDDFQRADNQRVRFLSRPESVRANHGRIVPCRDGESILGVLQQTHAELSHAKLHRFEVSRMKTIPQEIHFAAMQHEFA